MGCQCCRMIKSYIYDPSEEGDVRKAESSASSLYHPHHLSARPPRSDSLGRHGDQNQGFHNLGFSRSSDSTLKLEVDNNLHNHVVHGAPPSKNLSRQASAPPAEVYIIQPQALGSKWVVLDRGPSQVPVYPDTEGYQTQSGYGEDPPRPTRTRWGGGGDSPSADETDEGVGGTPEYLGDTGDEGSVLSVDIQTSTTSLSSLDTRDGLRPPKTPDASTVESGISVARSEDEDEPRREGGGGEAQSVTDSMVAEALAALEAATAGEDVE
ncbi:uncharacterized protein C4orf19 homolog [Antennarius striatus]|uniref:uncharacterized protein C4orf19 homolog n=1 Tax=Antennarius striatus TaxID=241820 RepID=UPI0035AF1F98